MPKQKAKRKFALVEKEILYSSVWRILKNSAKVVYVHLKGEFNGAYSERLILPACRMKGIIGLASFWRGIEQLEEIGFIDIVSRSAKPRFMKGCSNPKSEPNVYRLSGRWRLREKSVEEYRREKTEREQRKLHQEYCERQEDETQVS
jgi:hypothetical protein